MKWCNNLILDTNITENINHIKKKIKRNGMFCKYYLICLPSNKENLFDIFCSWELLQKHYQYYEPVVIGIAKTKEDAFELVKEIVDNMYKQLGRIDINQYMKDNHITIRQ